MDAGKVMMVLLDHNRIQIPGLKHFYTQVFLLLGYQLSIVEIDENPSNFEGKKSIFVNQIVDVFVVDISLGRSDVKDYYGLDIIAKVKKRYPELLTIANTSKNVPHLATSNKIPSFDVFVHKRKMNDLKYLNYIVRKIGDVFKRNVYLKVDFHGSTLSRKYSSTQKMNELENILRTVTFGTHSSDYNTAVTAVSLHQIEGGMSSSEVYRMKSFTSSGIQCVNSVLKLSEKSKAMRELDNYLQFVKWYLPYTWRAELIGHAFWKDLGCLCYSFVYNDDSPFNSLTHYILVGDLEKVSFAIDKIFKPKYQSWYHPKNLKKHNNITSYYNNKWFIDRSDPEDIFREILKRYDFTDPNYLNIEGNKYPMPGNFLLGVPRGHYSTCICHGDLNSNNVLIIEGGQLFFIDFQETGRGHVFEDFVVFESSIRQYYNLNLDFSTLVKLETLLLKEHILGEVHSSDIITDQRILKEIHTLRKYSFMNFNDEPVENYFYALAACCFGLLRYKNRIAEWQQNQLVACLLASMKCLEEIERGK